MLKKLPANYHVRLFSRVLPLAMLAIFFGSTLAVADQEEARQDLHSSYFKANKLELRKLRLDVQDVSYLWPTYNENELLRAIEPNNSKLDILPSRKAFQALQEFLKIESGIKLKNPLTGLAEGVLAPTDTLNLFGDLEDYRVVAFRFDDCGPFAGHLSAREKTPSWVTKAQQKIFTSLKTNCAPQLRLVLQPMMYWEDAALHFVYTYREKDGSGDADILRALIEDLLYLKSVNPVATTHHPLGPQLGLKDKQFQEKVLGFLRHYARSEFLEEIAVLSTNSFDGNSSWLFTSMKIDASGGDALVLNPMLAMKKSNLGLAFTSHDASEEFENPKLSVSDPATASLENILRLSNPRLTSNKSVDCLSCHSETRALVYKALHQPADLVPFAKKDSGLTSYADVTPWPDTDSLPTDQDGVENNFRQFGYFSSKPVVTFRTAFESAAVASSVNQWLSGKKMGTPSPPNRVSFQSILDHLPISKSK